MSTENDGGPAFPLVHPNPVRGTPYVLSNGMSLRDYFAGQALAGFCAMQHVNGDWSWNTRDAAQQAYEVADAMLAQKAKGA